MGDPGHPEQDAVAHMSLESTGPAGLDAIWLKIGHGTPMERVSHASLVKDYGLEGNADHGGYRQVTLLDAAAWQAATTEIDVEVDPLARRANLLLSGVDLADTRGRVLRIGSCRIQIRGETVACGLLDEAAKGLREALASDWRAGAYGMVLEGGPISVGDPVRWES